jgi:hypothetical protein
VCYSSSLSSFLLVSKDNGKELSSSEEGRIRVINVMFPQVAEMRFPSVMCLVLPGGEGVRVYSHNPMVKKKAPSMMSVMWPYSFARSGQLCERAGRAAIVGRD